MRVVTPGQAARHTGSKYLGVLVAAKMARNLNELRRNELSAGDYKDNIAAARFTPPRPEALALRLAVRHQPQAATGLIKALMGMTERAAFFNPDNLQRLMGAGG